MPRKLRFIIPGVPLHIVQHGHNRSVLFFEDEDYMAYINWLNQAALRYSCHVHAYALLPEHIHILVTPEDNEGVIRMMQYVGRFYVPYFNQKYGRCGALWAGRYKASLVQEEVFLLRCMRYIETLPMRLNKIKSLSDYQWSSHCHNGYGRGEHNVFLSPHAIYEELGDDNPSRRAGYLSLFESVESSEGEAKIKACWQSGAPLGDSRFKTEIESLLGQRVGYSQRGRPKLK